jgi:hypothetical protein
MNIPEARLLRNPNTKTESQGFCPIRLADRRERKWWLKRGVKIFKFNDLINNGPKSLPS